MRMRGYRALKSFLITNLDYDQYRKYFADELTEILQNNLTEISRGDRQLCRRTQCARRLCPDVGRHLRAVVAHSQSGAARAGQRAGGIGSNPSKRPDPWL